MAEYTCPNLFAISVSYAEMVTVNMNTTDCKVVTKKDITSFCNRKSDVMPLLFLYIVRKISHVPTHEMDDNKKKNRLYNNYDDILAALQS